MFTRAVRQGIIVVLLGGVLGVIANSSAPWGIPWVARPRTLATASDSLLARHTAPAANGAVVEPLSITLSQAKVLFDRDQAIFIDARPPYEYDEGHISGALNIPFEEIEYYRAEIEELPRDKILVVYCDGESCDLSVHLGDELAKRGFTEVRVFFGGWGAWGRAGFPITKRG